MNHLFDKFFRSQEILGEGAFLPAIDITESEGNIVLTAELPGVAESDLDIRVENGVLTLKGQKKFEQESKKDNCYRIERSYGTFQRSFTLPEGVKAEEIKAELKNGVLRVTIPQPEENKPKAIPISTE
jgi:HSP20 family protein